ncbi:sodium:solute symporter family protein [Bacillus sp. JJ1533]|uniref:sodium:solute symporter family protein n=1 Tax=Bacillus sp. JJ1533 TaxID=3122959 RepID=UPI002FFFEDEF
MSWIDWGCIAAYFILIGIIGYQSSKNVKSVEDYNVASEKVTWPVLFASLAAAVLGGGASTGTAGNTFKDGYVFMFAFFAYGFASVLIGIFIAPKLKNYVGAQTVGDIMEKHYGKLAKLLTGILSVCLCTGILGGQALALGIITNVILDIPMIWGIVIGMGFVIIYTAFGGIWAVIQTDVLQFVLLGIILPLALMISIHRIGGVDVILENVPAQHFSFLGNWELVTFIGIFITFLLGEALIPPYTQRAFSSKNSSDSRKGYIIAGLFSFGFFFVSASIGVVARVLYPDIRTDQAMPIIVKNILPIGITGLAIAALMAVIMSTASSFLNSTTVSFMQDIFSPFLAKRKYTDKEYLMIEKVFTLIVGVGSVIFAVNVPSIIKALEYSYYFWAPTIVFPLVIAIMGKVSNVYAGISSIIGGIVVTVLWTFILKDPFGLSGVVPGLIANMIVFLVVYLITRNSKRIINPPFESELK